MRDAEDRWILGTRLVCILVAIAMLATLAFTGYKTYDAYALVRDDVDDGLSAFQGAELIAARRALRTAIDCLGDNNFTRSALKVTDVEMTGEPFPSGAPRTTEFRAQVQAYTARLGGLSTEGIAVWTENYRILTDCGSVDM